jgi:hypothetical protein
MNLPTNLQSLLPILYELSDCGLVYFLSGTHGSQGDSQIVLNIDKLASEVHQLMFTEQAKVCFLEECNNEGNGFGFLPQRIVQSLLPAHVSMECLVHFHYCLEISDEDVKYFSSLTQYTV